MGYGYQKRDFEIIDYELFEFDGISRPFRGPRPEALEPGRYGAFIGAAQTFGCYTPKPFPRLVGEALGIETLNLGVAGAGPEFFLTRRNILALAQQARFVVLQIMSGRSVSNSVFDSNGGKEMLRHRATGVQQGAAPSYATLLREADRATVEAVLEETRQNWIDQYRELIAAIDCPVVLFWFSVRPIEYKRTFSDVQRLFGAFPQFVDASWLAPLRSAAEDVVVCVSKRGMPQRLVSRFTGAKTTITKREDLGGGAKKKNDYYPSPEMHEDAAAALIPALRKLV